MSNLIVAEVEMFQIRKVGEDCIVDVFYGIVTGVQYLARECMMSKYLLEEELICKPQALPVL
jgi:hypothetical protein